MSVHKDKKVYQVSTGSYKTGTEQYNRKIETTNATATVILSIPVAVGDAVLIMGSIIGKKSDTTAAIMQQINGGARRQSAGNVTLVGTPAVTGATMVQEDSGGTPAVTYVANTTDQALEIKVAGIAAETWSWEGNFKVTKI